MNSRPSTSAFSLLETLIAVAVIGIIAAIGYGYNRVSIEEIRVAKLEADISTLNGAVKAYLANGGSLAGVTNPQAVLDKMKTTLSAEEGVQFVGIRGSMVDPRLAAAPADDLTAGHPRAVWNSLVMRFQIEPNGDGVSRFYLDSAKGKAGYGTESRSSAFAYNPGDGWVWNYEESSALPRPSPTLVTVGGIPTEVPGATSDPTPWSDPVISNLLPPTFSVEAGTYRPSTFPIYLELTNPNPAATSRILVSINGTQFHPYAGSIRVESGTTVAAFVTGDPSLWFPSPTVAKSYTASQPEQLAAPVISPSSPQFQWDTAETITVSISNPNSSEHSSLQYHIGDGIWTAYSESFPLDFSSNPDGAVVSARAVPLSADYLESQVSTASIAPAPPQQTLLAPVITTSDPMFIAGAVETITVSISNPNEAGAALDYRLEGGSWQTYSGSFSLHQSTYPLGVTIEARCRAISRAYLDSVSSSVRLATSPIDLRPPNIIPTAANFIVGAVETVNVTVTNPNPAAAGSLLDYRINGGAWVPYTAALSFTQTAYSSGLEIAARARTTSAAYLTSPDASFQIGVTGVPLIPPGISPSAPNFVAERVETITITLTRHDPGVTTVVYRLNGGAWQTYDQAFTVTRSAYPSGVQVEARANGTTTAAATSAISALTIGLAPLPLRRPLLLPGAANFIAGITDVISVSVADPNPQGGATEYRVNGADWQAYNAPFSVSLTDFPSGVMLEARSRATSPAYADSGIDLLRIGLTLARLRRPIITTSSASLVAGTTESISVSIANLNADAAGLLEYRLDAGAWQAYDSAFSITRSAYPSGVTIEARVSALSFALLDSDLDTAVISLTPARLRAPTVTSSAPAFIAGFVESATITIAATDASSEVVDYRLNGQAWQTYASPFPVTRTSYPNGVAIEARSRSSSPALDPSEIASVTVAINPIQLRLPAIARSANFFQTATATVTVTLTNPNPSGSLMDYRLNNGAWRTYSTPFTVSRSNFSAGVTIEARARSISAAFLSSGSISATVGTVANQLHPPFITPSTPNFLPGFQDSISVQLINPNASGSAVEYRINGGDWQAYSSNLTFTRANHPSGLTVEARARALTDAFLTSGNAILALGVTPVQLRAPSIASSAPSFSAGTSDTVTVTLSNPDDQASVLDYRLNGGSWLSYSAALPLTLGTYPNGVTIEARSRSTTATFATSSLASAFIGVAPVRLRTPSISTTASNFLAGSSESVTVTIDNPNNAGFALEYRLGTRAWLPYTAPFVVTQQSYQSGITIESRARALTAAYLDSSIAFAAIGNTRVLLRRPSIVPSSATFLPGTTDSVTITITNPNPAGSVVDYRINNGAWLVYSAPFTVTRTSFPNGVPIEARARALSIAYATSGSSTYSVGLTPVQLLTPFIRPSASDFIPGSVDTLTVTLVNPNPTGSVTQYRINGGGWATYSTPFVVRRASYPTGLSVETRALNTQRAFAPSSIGTANFGVAVVQLLPPMITPSAPSFVAGTRDIVSISLTNPNPTGSSLQYRLNSGAWVNYVRPFNVTRGVYPRGVTVQSRALAATRAYLTSNNALTSIGLTTLTLQTPTLTPSARSFRIGSVESITVTITNPNPQGVSSLQYRINSGSWQGYTGAITVTRTNYPSGLSVSARAVAASSTSGYGTSLTGVTTIGLTQVQLLPPSLTKSIPNFIAGTGETVTITLSNPNGAGSALQYRLAGGGWTNYTAPFNLTRSRFPRGVLVEARARATVGAYQSSTIASSNVGIGTVQLQIPVITAAALSFMAGTTEAITVTVSNPNPSGSSTLQYRIDGGAWRNYSRAFSVNRSTYPTGLTIEAQARTSSTVYVTSTTASTNIGLTTVRLAAPTITRSAANFLSGTVETISISLTNPNPTGTSVTEYRLNGGSWLTYTAAFNLTRSAYPSGVTVDARARSNSVAHTDSTTATSTIGAPKIQLQTPMLRRSSPNFIPTQMESVTVTILNPNASTVSALDYRINDGSWVAYSAPFPLTRESYPNGCTIQARARSISPGHSDSSTTSGSIGLKLNATKTTVTFTSMASSAGYLNESYIYVDGDAYYLGNSDMGAGFAVNIDVYLEPGVTNVFDLSIDTYMRSGGRFISGALRGLDTRTGSLFTLIASDASFRGQTANSAKIKDLSYQSNLNMIVGYEDLIIANQNPDWDYDDFMFRLTSDQAFNFTFGGFSR